MRNKPKILIVEDHLGHRAIFNLALKRQVAIQEAATLKEAYQKFQQDPDVDLIVMDGLLGNESSVEFVRHVRKSFNGPMIAMSGSDTQQKHLMRAGCCTQCNKSDLPKTVLLLLSHKLKNQ